MASDIITVQGLCKKFGEVTAVDAISFRVHAGSLFAFLGPNGAGKTTTIQMLCTLLAADRGKASIDGHALGHDDEKIRRRIGVVFQHNILDDLLTVRENLLTHGALYGLAGSALQRRLDEVADIMGLRDLLKRRYGKMSGGQRRRTEIARALMNDPAILFLDEPTTGLDPQSRKRVWQTIRSLQSELKMSVFLTTHYLEEAANADWVTIIDQGRIVAEGTPSYLRETYSQDHLHLTPKNQLQAEMFLQNRGLSFQKISDQLLIPVENSLVAYELLKGMEGNFSRFEVIRGDMDDVFVSITGHKIRED